MKITNDVAPDIVSPDLINNADMLVSVTPKPPGMKDIEPTLQNRLDRGVYPGGTRQWESTGESLDPKKVQAFSEYWNFGQNQIDKKAMTMSWVDQV